MARHTIALPHPPETASGGPGGAGYLLPMRPDPQETIVWDDDAGTVEGDGISARMLGRLLDAIRADAGTLDLSDVGRVLVLEDPAHDPRDFWWLLPARAHHAEWREHLPPILRDIEPTPAADPGGSITWSEGMAGVHIDIDVVGLERVQRVITRLRETAQDVDPILRDIGEYLLNQTKDRFGTAAGPDGRPWEPLQPGYAEEKEKRRPNAGMLVYDDLLRGQLAYLVSDGELALGTNRPYGARQHFGFDGPDSLGRIFSPLSPESPAQPEPRCAQRAAAEGGSGSALGSDPDLTISTPC